MGTVRWPLAAMLLPRVLSSPSPPCTTDSEAMTLSAEPETYGPETHIAKIPLQQITCPVLAACFYPTSESKFCRNPSCAWGVWATNPSLTQDKWGRTSCDQTQDPNGAPWSPCKDLRLVPSLCPSLFNEQIEDYEYWKLNGTIPENWPDDDGTYTLARGTLGSGSSQETVFISAIDVDRDGTAMAWAFSGSLAHTYAASDTLTLHVNDPIIITGDPHLHFAHGGSADYRGEDGAIVCFFSAPGIALNIKTEDATFTPPWWPGTTIEGSYITEVPPPSSPLPLPGEARDTARLAPRRTSSHAWAEPSASGQTLPSSPHGSPSSTRASTSSPAPAAATPSRSGSGQSCAVARSSPSSRTTRSASLRRPLSPCSQGRFPAHYAEIPSPPPPHMPGARLDLHRRRQERRGLDLRPKAPARGINIHSAGDAAARSLPHGIAGKGVAIGGVVQTLFGAFACRHRGPVLLCHHTARGQARRLPRQLRRTL